MKDAMEIAQEVAETRKLVRIEVDKPCPQWMSKQNYQLQV